MSETKFVTTGKPKKGGAIFVAPLGTPLPTSTSEKLNAAFLDLGYMSDAGVVNDNSATSNDVKAWGGKIVLSTQTEKKDTYKYTMIEALNINVLKAVYGDENVSENGESSGREIIVKANDDEQEEHCWVIDQIMKNGSAKRIVIPNGKITSVGEVTYNDTTPVGYETTVTCFPDSYGQTHYEYITIAG